MKKTFTKFLAALMLLAIFTPSFTAMGQTKITDYSNIVSGNTYYIGATTGGTDYYLYVYHDYNSTSTAGTAQTSMNDATTFVFEGSGTSWTIKFDNGKYLSLKDSKDNGKVQVVTDPATFTTSNQSGKIRLSKGNYSVQKNNSGTQFGSYANTQTDIWLMEVPSSLSLTTVTINDSGITNTDVYVNTAAGTLTASVTETESGNAVSGATVTWSSSNESVATIANDGTVTLVAEGTTTITAYYAGVSGEYGESSATYELNVSDSTPFAGGDVTFVAGTDLGTTTTNADGDSMTKKGVTVSSTSAAFATAEYRIYSGSTTTISTSFGTITRIEFTKNGNYSLGNLSTETGTYTSSTGVWTGNVSSIDFSASAQVRLNQIVVTVTAPSSAVATTTTITVPSGFNTDLHNGTNAGTLTASVTETEGGAAVSGATVTWSSSNTSVATIASNGAVTLVAVGTTTITASYAGVEDEYKPSTGTYELEVTDSTPVTYTVTFDAGDGTFVGNSDFPNASNAVTAGTYTLPSATPATGYTFSKWNIGDATYDAGASYTVSGNADFVASYTQNGGGSTKTLTFDMSSNPGDWPTANSTTLTNYTYTLNNVDYTFALKNVKCNSGYLMITQVGVVGLPAIEGYKLTKVVASNSGGCSTSTKVGISSSASQASYITGGEIQTWSTQGSSYTYTLTSTDANTMYYMYVTNKNAQITSLELTYEAAEPSTDPSISADDVNIAYDANSGIINYEITNPVTGGAISASTEYDWITGFTYTQGTTGTVTFTTNGNNPYCYERPATVTLTYTYDNNQTVTKTVAITQALNPNAPGTVNDPYTVAEARAAIDDNQGITGVYATGIVTAIPTAWSSQYNNITFNFVDNSGDTEFLQAYRCVSGTGVDASTVAVGDIVVVSGDLTKHNSTYEFGQGCQLVSLTHPAVEVEAPTFNPVAGIYTTTQNVTISCETSGATIYYTIDGTEPSSTSTEYTTAIPVSTTTTIKAIAIKGGNSSTVASATYAFLEHAGTEADPYTVADAYAAIDANAGITNVYATGIVSEIVTAYSSQYGNISYNISSDGTTTSDQLQAYRGKSYNGENFTSEDDIQVGDIVVVYGTLQYYNGTYEFVAANQLVSLIRNTTYELTIAGYTDAQATNGWYLIASPVMEDITPAAGNGFITSAYDLYRFNPTAQKEWENWKTEGNHYQFPIEHGRGYLYASQTTTTLEFTGTPHTDSEVTLAYTGWNLIGNPSNIEGAISENFYVMNDDHNDLVAAGSGRTVHGLEGIFVYGNQGNEITFEEQPAKRTISQVTLNIVGSNGNVIDRAIVNFDSNNTLAKFMLDESNTKIYIPQSDANYAVVSSNGKGNMPVNFKAARTGKYTLRVETEGVDMNYMHIIDRLTGEDINVLLDNEYSFIASQNDVEGRFILSFNENGYNADADETFAFQNGSDVIVNGNGELQVFDVTGRMVMNTMINGIQNVNMPNGVYVFRMIGETVKTQKIVVR